MEKQPVDCGITPDAVSLNGPALVWLPPLQSIAMYSLAELTQEDASPGDDGLGVFTHS